MSPPSAPANQIQRQRGNAVHAAQRNLEGAVSATKLGELFQMNVAAVRQKIATVKPVDEYNGAPRYLIRDVAPYLCKPVANLEELIKNLRPKDLPLALQRDFWAAQRARQQYEEDAGQLWRTPKVRQVIGGLVQLIRQRVLLFRDTAERQTELTPEQSELIQRLSDGLLDALHTAVLDTYADYDAEGDHEDIYEHGVDDAPDDDGLDDGLDEGL